MRELLPVDIDLERPVMAAAILLYEIATLRRGKRVPVLLPEAQASRVAEALAALAEPDPELPAGLVRDSQITVIPWSPGESLLTARFAPRHPKRRAGEA